jgi:hypothetical protein
MIARPQILGTMKTQLTIGTKQNSLKQRNNSLRLFGRQLQKLDVAMLQMDPMYTSLVDMILKEIRPISLKIMYYPWSLHEVIYDLK